MAGLFDARGFVDIASAKVYIFHCFLFLSMAQETKYIADLLGFLQARLLKEGRTAEAGNVGKVRERIVAAKDDRLALEELYAVDGWDQFALRLMWYQQAEVQTGAGSPETARSDFWAEKLERALLSPEESSPATPPPAQEPSGAPASQDLRQALDSFVKGVKELKRSSHDGQAFLGMQRPQLEAVVREAGALQAVGNAEGNDEVVRFSAAFSLFAQYVLDEQRFQDVRAVNLIDNACLTLQTVLEGVGAEDYDALQQTIQLLEDPRTLLE